MKVCLIRPPKKYSFFVIYSHSHLVMSTQLDVGRTLAQDGPQLSDTDPNTEADWSSAPSDCTICPIAPQVFGLNEIILLIQSEPPSLAW